MSATAGTRAIAASTDPCGDGPGHECVANGKLTESVRLPTASRTRNADRNRDQLPVSGWPSSAVGNRSGRPPASATQ